MYVMNLELYGILNVREIGVSYVAHIDVRCLPLCSRFATCAGVPIY